MDGNQYLSTNAELVATIVKGLALCSMYPIKDVIESIRNRLGCVSSLGGFFSGREDGPNYNSAAFDFGRLNTLLGTLTPNESEILGPILTAWALLKGAWPSLVSGCNHEALVRAYHTVIGMTTPRPGAELDLTSTSFLVHDVLGVSVACEQFGAIVSNAVGVTDILDINCERDVYLGAGECE